ncbi:Y4yA family PLP-dependent enzyme [Roseiconus lacunae]|uniref:Y4yA family PLP-dependent enzyme n=1 Tax=Roseiconus lacunae TaxID=2605694 RepID=UPI0030856E6B|nr:Y4yA family PLP-dependent enzyme [Stieleria sp. HD01]
MTKSVEPPARTIRSHCHGMPPLDAKIASWMQDALNDPRLFDWIDSHGSPLNLIHREPMSKNVAELDDVAKHHEVDFQVFFARKSNKCLTFIEQTIHDGVGIDTASEIELLQAIDRGVAAKDLICTAAVKSESLLTTCVRHGVGIAIDNEDELALATEIAKTHGRPAQLALRLGGFWHQGEKLFTRFGFNADDVGLLGKLDRDVVNLVGFHFHLDGYDASQRIDAIECVLRWIDRAKEQQFAPQFIDIGGGFPMSYLHCGDQWQTFWAQLESALLGKRDPVTYRNHGLGLLAINGQIHGVRQSYPYYQSPVRADWLDSILSAPIGDELVADAIKRRDLQLRCEPGRSLMDGCGMTIARVEFCKRNSDNDLLVGLAMNRTQCRTSSDDFLVDPIVIKKDSHNDGAEQFGYLVGAYCTESELISLRKLRFPYGIQRGDLVVFPNTAGYLMHFLESRSHQFPLAKNLVYDDPVRLDPIDVDAAHP